MIPYRVWAEVDLDALSSNLAEISRLAGPGVGTMLVVKADAYGHGAVAIAHHAVRCGVAGFGVGTSAEALELRLSGIRHPILVLGTVVDGEVPALLEEVRAVVQAGGEGATGSAGAYRGYPGRVIG